MEIMDDLLGALARLDARLEGLEHRVSALEARSQTLATSPAQAAVPEEAATAGEELALPPAENIFSVVGKAMLGIAGAYVLRAIAESGSFPKLAVVVLALAYAAMWLAWAARAAAEASLTRIAYATTAALILAPMLAELTLRFQVLPASITAGLLSAFVVAACALAWKRNLVSLVWVANSAAVLAALALLIVSHDLVPYTAALLVIAAVAEFGATAGRWPSLRILVAPAVDIAVVILVYIHSLPESSRPDYAAVAASTVLAIPTLLFLIYGASIASRTAFVRLRITIFEIVQAVTVFLLAATSWLWFAAGAGRALGVCCWLLAAACYAAAFACFDRIKDQRNYHTYSTWSLALVLAGSFLVLPPVSLVLFLSAASVVAILIGVRVARLTLEFHGLVYLTGAAFASNLLAYAARALAGTFPTAPAWIVWIVAASAITCYVVGGRFPSDHWNQRLLRLLAAVLAVSAVATFLVSGLVWLAAIGMTPGASHVAVIRTLITCALALALALSGSRWRRIELVWTAYGTLAFVTAKLLFEDLPHGHSASIAISIFLYAIALIIVPRLARTGR
ncbi:MAG: hypothetical protein WAU58_17520 [Terriglobales bacterium]